MDRIGMEFRFGLNGIGIRNDRTDRMNRMGRIQLDFEMDRIGMELRFDAIGIRMNINGNRNGPNGTGLLHGLKLNGIPDGNPNGHLNGNPNGHPNGNRDAHPTGHRNLRLVFLLWAGPRVKSAMAPSGEKLDHCVSCLVKYRWVSFFVCPSVLEYPSDLRFKDRWGIHFRT